MQLSVLGSILLYVGTFGLSALASNFKIKNKFLKFFIIILPPVFLATFRYNIGYDYGSYIQGFINSYDCTLESIFSSYDIGDPIAYNFITKVMTFFDSDRLFLMVLSLLSLIPGLIYILNDWKDVNTKSLMIFIYLFIPFIFSFSACKQGIALSILIYSLKYVFNRKLFKFLLCVLLAFLFHSTSIIFIFVYFMLDKKGNFSLLKKIFLIIACVFIIINLQLILEGFMGGRYETYAIDNVEGRNRTFWLYSLLASIFLIFRKKLILIDKRNDLLIMMMIIGAITQYLGFSNAFAKRIGEYFLVAQVFLIPQCIYIFKRSSRSLIFVLIVLYVVGIFLIANPTASSGMGFVPYRFIFGEL